MLVNPTIIFEKEPDEKVVLKNIRTGMDPQAPDTVHRLPVDDAFNAENKFSTIYCRRILPARGSVSIRNHLSDPDPIQLQILIRN